VEFSTGKVVEWEWVVTEYYKGLLRGSLCWGD
jgi:hypothetical protein